MRTFNLIFASLGLEGLAFNSGLRVTPLSKILLGNALMLILSLGFAYPWTKVRLMRYKLEAIEYKGNVDHFSGAKVSADTALGDEVGDAFDLDFGFGL